MRIAFINHVDGQGPLEWATVGINCIPDALVCTEEDTVDNYAIGNIENRLEDLGQKYDLVVMSLNDVDRVHWLVSVQHIKQGSGGRLVMFVDGVAGRFEEIDYRQRVKYLDVLNEADFLLANSETGKAYLEYIVEDPGKIISIGLPVNIELIEKSTWEGIQDKDRIYLGYMYYRPSSQLFACMFALKKLGLRGLIAGLNYPKTKEYYTQILYSLGLADTIQLVPDKPQNKALEYMYMCGASLSMGVRDSLGRLAAEGAVCGIPAIGTVNYFQERLFPALTLEPFAFVDVADGLAQAINHSETYLEPAHEAVQEYSYPAWRERFLKAVMDSDPDIIRDSDPAEQTHDLRARGSLAETPGGGQESEKDN